MRKYFGSVSAILTALLVSMLAFSGSAGAAHGPNFTPGNITSCGHLTTPGTYTLKNNIVGPAFQNCFVVDADGVTLEGGGFTITGGSPFGADGVNLLSRSNVTVNNLIIKGFSVGIRLNGTSGQGSDNNIITNNQLDSTRTSA